MSSPVPYIQKYSGTSPRFQDITQTGEILQSNLVLSKSQQPRPKLGKSDGQEEEGQTNTLLLCVLPSVWPGYLNKEWSRKGFSASGCNWSFQSWNLSLSRSLLFFVCGEAHQQLQNVQNIRPSTQAPYTWRQRKHCFSMQAANNK